MLSGVGWLGFLGVYSTVLYISSNLGANVKIFVLFFQVLS